MRFADPWLLLLALAAAPLAFARWRRPAPAIAVPFAGGLADAPVGWRVRARRLLPVLRVVAVLLLVAGVARPRAGEADRSRPPRAWTSRSPSTSPAACRRARSAAAARASTPPGT